MKNARSRPGFTIVELLVVALAITLLLAAILPSIARAQGSSGVQQSMSNLATLGVAHVIYALDWDDRQVTWVKDDLGVFGGDVEAYNDAAGTCSGWPWPYPAECQPAIIAGRGCDGLPWGYWPNHSNRFMLQPMNFPSGPQGSGIAGWGNWRVPNPKSFHDYVNGRYHDPGFYAPNDTVILERVLGGSDVPRRCVAHQRRRRLAGAMDPRSWLRGAKTFPGDLSRSQDPYARAQLAPRPAGRMQPCVVRLRAVLVQSRD
jgi:type II secretory pathway pseudopilin PulG